MLFNKAVLNRTFKNRKYGPYYYLNFLDPCQHHARAFYLWSSWNLHQSCEVRWTQKQVPEAGLAFWPCISMRRPHTYQRWSQVSCPSPRHEAGHLYRQHRSQPGCSSSPAPSQDHPQQEWSLSPLSSQNLHDIWPEKEKEFNSNWNSWLSHKTIDHIKCTSVVIYHKYNTVWYACPNTPKTTSEIKYQ